MAEGTDTRWDADEDRASIDILTHKEGEARRGDGAFAHKIYYKFEVVQKKEKSE